MKGFKNSHSAKQRTPIERPERLEYMKSYLTYLKLWQLCHLISLRSVTDEEVSCAHSLDLIKRVESLIADSKDVTINELSLKLTKICAGTLIDLIDKVISNKYNNGIAFLRPPGHHSESNKTMGFCMYKNNYYFIDIIILLLLHYQLVIHIHH